MVRAFSLPSESLSYFIGFALLHSERIIIVSPWLSNVQITFPVNDRISSRTMSLVAAFEAMPEKDVDLLVRAGEDHNDYIQNRLPSHVRFQAIEGLHAKAVITDEFVYLGSANITKGGLSINRELCEILENEYDSAAEYVRNHLDLDVSW